MVSSAPPLKISLAKFIKQLVPCPDLAEHDPDYLVPECNGGKPFGGLIHPYKIIGTITGRTKGRNLDIMA